MKMAKEDAWYKYAVVRAWITFSLELIGFVVLSTTLILRLME